MQSRETGRITKTKSPRIPSHPQSPNNGALFIFAIRPSQRIATPAPAESPVPTDVTGNRLTAPAHTETRPVPPSKGTDRYNLKRIPFVSMMCIRAIVRPALFHNAAHGRPLQPQISRRQL